MNTITLAMRRAFRPAPLATVVPERRPAMMPASADAAAATIVHALLSAGYTGPQAATILAMRDADQAVRTAGEFSARLERAMPGIGAAR